MSGVGVIVASLTSEGDRFAIGGVVGGLVVLTLISLVLTVVGILVWHRSVYNMAHPVIWLSV